MSEQLLGHRPALEDNLDESLHFVCRADELFYAFPRAHWPLTRTQQAEAFAGRCGNRRATLLQLHKNLES